MKIRVMVLSCLIGSIGFPQGGVPLGSRKAGFLGVEFRRAVADPILQWEVKADPVRDPKGKVSNGGRIGVVNVRKIFQDCKRNAGYREEVVAERGRIVAELDGLSREIEAERAGLKALREVSDDYMASMKEILEKQARLQSQQEFYKLRGEYKEKRWTEGLYKDILRATGEVAKQRGLDLVLEKDEVELPAPSANELMLTIRTHKLLYSGGCLDITDEVMARVDEQDAK